MKKKMMMMVAARAAALRSALIVLLALGGTLPSCSLDTAKKHYVLADKFWNDGKYRDAVREFEKVIERDPEGPLGKQALFRAGMTETLFLKEYTQGLRRFKQFIALPGIDKELVWKAEVTIGEILFEKLRRYGEAIKHYEALLEERPGANEAPLFRFRIAKSHFFKWHFSDAIRRYHEVMALYPDTKWSERAMYEIGNVYFTGGEQQVAGLTPEQARKQSQRRRRRKKEKDLNAYEKAIQAYRDFIAQYPKSEHVQAAKFGIASCYEELDQLETALTHYKALEKNYPSPNVIKIKMIRIRERITKRGT